MNYEVIRLIIARNRYERRKKLYQLRSILVFPSSNMSLLAILPFLGLTEFFYQNRLKAFKLSSLDGCLNVNQ